MSNEELSGDIEITSQLHQLSGQSDSSLLYCLHLADETTDPKFFVRQTSACIRDKEVLKKFTAQETLSHKEELARLASLLSHKENKALVRQKIREEKQAAKRDEPYHRTILFTQLRAIIYYARYQSLTNKSQINNIEVLAKEFLQDFFKMIARTRSQENPYPECWIESCLQALLKVMSDLFAANNNATAKLSNFILSELNKQHSLVKTLKPANGQLVNEIYPFYADLLSRAITYVIGVRVDPGSGQLFKKKLVSFGVNTVAASSAATVIDKCMPEDFIAEKLVESERYFEKIVKIYQGDMSRTVTPAELSVMNSACHHAAAVLLDLKHSGFCKLVDSVSFKLLELTNLFLLYKVRLMLNRNEMIAIVERHAITILVYSQHNSQFQQKNEQVKKFNARVKQFIDLLCTCCVSSGDLSVLIKLNSSIQHMSHCVTLSSLASSSSAAVDVRPVISLSLADNKIKLPLPLEQALSNLYDDIPYNNFRQLFLIVNNMNQYFDFYMEPENAQGRALFEKIKAHMPEFLQRLLAPRSMLILQLRLMTALIVNGAFKLYGSNKERSNWQRSNEFLAYIKNKWPKIILALQIKSFTSTIVASELEKNMLSLFIFIGVSYYMDEFNEVKLSLLAALKTLKALLESYNFKGTYVWTLATRLQVQIQQNLSKNNTESIPSEITKIRGKGENIERRAKLTYDNFIAKENFPLEALMKGRTWEYHQPALDHVDFLVSMHHYFSSLDSFNDEQTHMLEEYLKVCLTISVQLHCAQFPTTAISTIYFNLSFSLMRRVLIKPMVSPVAQKRILDYFMVKTNLSASLTEPQQQIAESLFNEISSKAESDVAKALECFQLVREEYKRGMQGKSDSNASFAASSTTRYSKTKTNTQRKKCVESIGKIQSEGAPAWAGFIKLYRQTALIDLVRNLLALSVMTPKETIINNSYINLQMLLLLSIVQNLLKTSMTDKNETQVFSLISKNIYATFKQAYSKRLYFFPEEAAKSKRFLKTLLELLVKNETSLQIFYINQFTNCFEGISLEPIAGFELNTLFLVTFNVSDGINVMVQLSSWYNELNRIDNKQREAGSALIGLRSDVDKAQEKMHSTVLSYYADLFRLSILNKQFDFYLQHYRFEHLSEKLVEILELCDAVLKKPEPLKAALNVDVFMTHLTRIVFDKLFKIPLARYDDELKQVFQKIKDNVNKLPVLQDYSTLNVAERVNKFMKEGDRYQKIKKEKATFNKQKSRNNKKRITKKNKRQKKVLPKAQEIAAKEEKDQQQAKQELQRQQKQLLREKQREQDCKLRQIEEEAKKSAFLIINKKAVIKELGTLEKVPALTPKLQTKAAASSSECVTEPKEEPTQQNTVVDDADCELPAILAIDSEGSSSSSASSDTSPVAWASNSSEAIRAVASQQSASGSSDPSLHSAGILSSSSSYGPVVKHQEAAYHGVLGVSPNSHMPSAAVSPAYPAAPVHTPMFFQASAVPPLPPTFFLEYSNTTARSTSDTDYVFQRCCVELVKHARFLFPLNPEVAVSIGIFPEALAHPRLLADVKRDYDLYHKRAEEEKKNQALKEVLTLTKAYFAARMFSAHVQLSHERATLYLCEANTLLQRFISDRADLYTRPFVVMLAGYINAYRDNYRLYQTSQDELTVKLQ